MRDLEFAKVVDSHPAANAVDILMLRTGQQIPLVQCLTPFAGTDCGESGFAQPTIADPANKFSPKQTKVRDIYCIVGFTSDRPIVLGFMYPQVSELLFRDLLLRIRRDPSDVYTSTDDDGNFEFYHPSGTYFRIAVDPAHKDLTGLDLDGQWKIKNNTDRAVHVHLEVHNAGSATTTLDIDPTGDITLTNQGGLSATVGGNLSAVVAGTALVQSGGDATYRSATKVTIDAPASKVTGTLEVDGQLTTKAGIQNTGGITDGGVNVGATHVHGGVTTGGGNTAVPH